jgi:tripartite-type tricarboxylate transporter receptor subunit TctC
MMFRRSLLLSTLATPALAQTRPTRIIVPFPPGGFVDILARPLAAKLQTLFNAPFIIENRGGAGGNIGAEAVARAEPDGHTLMLSPIGPLSLNMWLFPSLSYDPRTAFAPISLVVRSPKVFCVPPGRPWRSLGELIEAARAAPGQLSAGSAGNGSSLHIALELFNRAAGVQITHVPYRGAAPAITDLVAGRLDLIIDNVPNILGQLRAGAVRPLATATPERMPQLPEVPTTAEAGLPGFLFGTWFGLVAPAGTPAPLVQRISAAVDDALRDPEVGGRFTEQGAVLAGGSPENFAQFLDAERTRLEPLIRGAGIRAD